MALIVEDGSVVTGAESYVDIEYIDNYLSNRGYTAWTTLSDVVKETAIRRAIVFIEGFSFLGSRSSDSQVLEFPREGIYYPSGIEMIGVVPNEIKNALCEAAYIESQESGSLFPTQSDRSLKKRKVGSLEREFYKSSGGLNSQQPIIANLLRRFIYSGRRVSRC